MSKYVKNLLANELQSRLEGVEDAIIVDVIGMDSDATFRVRKLLREKGIQPPPLPFPQPNGPFQPSRPFHTPPKPESPNQ